MVGGAVVGGAVVGGAVVGGAVVGGAVVGGALVGGAVVGDEPVGGAVVGEPGAVNFWPPGSGCGPCDAVGSRPSVGTTTPGLSGAGRV